MCAKEPNFIARQYAFTAFVRDPMNAPAPADVPRARLQVYRELFHKNIDNSLSACFPVLKAILGDEWDPLVQDFFARHRAHTPIYRKLPREFLAYLDARDVSGYPTFLRELAHYEWIELDLTLDAADFADVAADPRADLLTGIPVVSPLARILEYTFPVHRLAPDFAPTAAPDARTHLIVYRDRADHVGFFEINALTAVLLGILREEPCTGAEALAHIAAHAQLDAETVRAFGAELLADLRQRDVIVGSRKRNLGETP